MKGRMSTDLGSISIDAETIAQYAGTEAMECFGIVGMAGYSMKDGIVKLLKQESLTRGINVTLNKNKISIDFHIIVAYGVSIRAIADNLMSNVKYKVEGYTGLNVEKINIFVEGVKVIEEL
ncbi:MAG: Asp23/Gls24 family envelope stress response protein [Lachnospiraceae bacterium]|nr:Asp23/Gls24 family envelope stress response protein [Lachnospiraceae bacterium]